MHPDEARRLDKLLTPVCSSLGVLRRLLGAPPARLITEGEQFPDVAGKSTAVIKLAGLGSLSFLAPILRAYGQATAPSVQYLVTQEENKTLLDLFDWPIQPLYLSGGRRTRTLWAGLKLMRQLRSLRLAAIVDIEYYSRACTLLSLWSGSPIRIAFSDGRWRRSLVTHLVPWSPRWHLAKVTAHILGRLAGQNVEAAVDLPLKPGVLGPPPVPKTPGRYLVCVNVNTSVLGVEGRLPLGHFRGLLARLAAETPVHLVFIGSKGEAPYVERAVAMFEGIAPLTNVAGRTTVAELLSLIKHADLLITNDTGPLHLAVGLRTPSLSFFGPANPANFGPREGPHTIAYGDAMCSPCINEANMKKPPCRGRNVCIAAMDPEDLGRLAVETMLSPPPAPRIVSPRLLEPDEVKRVLLNNAEEGRE